MEEKQNGSERFRRHKGVGVLVRWSSVRKRMPFSSVKGSVAEGQGSGSQLEVFVPPERRQREGQQRPDCEGMVHSLLHEGLQDTALGDLARSTTSAMVGLFLKSPI